MEEFGLFLFFTCITLFHCILYHIVFYLGIFRAYLKLGAHGVWGNGAEVKDAYWGAGVDGLGAELQVGVAQHTAHSLWVTNLAAGIQVVLAAQNLVWAKLAKVLGLNNLTGNQAGG